MLRVESLPGYDDVNNLLPDDVDVRLAVTLLCLQAFAHGQIDGVRRTEAAAYAVLRDTIFPTHKIETADDASKQKVAELPHDGMTPIDAWSRMLTNLRTK